MKNLPVLLFALFLAAGCASAPPAPVVKAPAWVTDQSSVYPDLTHLVFIGSGTTVSQAKSDGLAQLSAYFGVSVKSITEGFEAYNEEQSKGRTSSTLERSVNSKVTAVTNNKLFAVEYGEAFTDKTGVQIPAFLVRAKAARVWDAEISSSAERFARFIDRANDAKASLLSRLAAMKAAGVLLTDLTAWKKTWRQIAPDGAKLTTDFDPAAFDAVVRSLQDITGIQVAASGEDAARIQGVISDRLSVAGFTTSAKGKLRLPAKITIETGDAGYGLSSAKWTVDLALEEGGEAIFNQLLEGKSGGSSPAAARTKALKDMTDALDSKFVPKLIEKLLSGL